MHVSFSKHVFTTKSPRYTPFKQDFVKSFRSLTECWPRVTQADNSWQVKTNKGRTAFALMAIKGIITQQSFHRASSPSWSLIIMRCQVLWEMFLQADKKSRQKPTLDCVPTVHKIKKRIAILRFWLYLLQEWLSTSLFFATVPHKNHRSDSIGS